MSDKTSRCLLPLKYAGNDVEKLEFEGAVEAEYSPKTGELMSHYVRVSFVLDGRTGLLPGDSVVITIRRWVPERLRR